MIQALRQKLVEEAHGAHDAQNGLEMLGELADVLEVIRAWCRAIGVSPEELEAERAEKHRRRGGFEKGLMLAKTTDPHSLPPRKSDDNTGMLQLSAESHEPAPVSRALDLPAPRHYRRPDLRYVEEHIEKVVTFEMDLSRIKDDK